MRRVMPILASAMLAVACTDGDPAAAVDGFDGFPWGSTRADIVRLRGSPDFEDSFPGWVYAVWSAHGSESIGGLAIESITYRFKDECREPEIPCHLWAGEYDLENKSLDAAASITEQLSAKYGAPEYVEQRFPEEGFSADSGSRMFDRILTTNTWSLADGSAVILRWSRYDEDFVDVQGYQITAGVKFLNLSYESGDFVATNRAASALGEQDKPL